jgi:chromosome segregation ATPase
MASKLTKEHLEQIAEYIAEKFPGIKQRRSSSANSREIEIDIRERIVRVEEELKNQSNIIRELIISMDKRFQEFRFEMNARFEQVDKRLDQVDKRLDQVDKRLDQVDKRLDQVDKRFDQVDKRFDQIDKHFDQIDKHFEQIDKHFEHVNKRFEQVDKHFEQVSKRFELTDKQIDNLRTDMDRRFTMMMWFTGLGLTIVTTFLTGALVLLR